MVTENPKDEFVSEQDVEEIGRMLRDLRSPDDLLRSGSTLLDSRLYQRLQQADPQAPPYQVLKNLLCTVLNDLEQENPEYATILRQRFWKGTPAKEIILNASLSERTFYFQQSRAIRLFAFLLLQKEQTAGQQPGPLPLESHRPGRISRPVVIYASLGLLLLFVLLWHLAPRASAPPAGPAPLETPPAEAAAALVLPQPTPEPASPSPTPLPPTPEPTPTPAAAAEPEAPSICGEPGRVTVQGVSRFVRHQGVSVFTGENTEGAVQSDRVRTLTMDASGLWIGYFSRQGGSQPGGVGHYDKATWAACLGGGAALAENVNDLLTTPGGQVWVAYEKHGIGVFNGAQWTHYTEADGLPSNDIYGLTLDEAGNVWAATWEGVALFDGSAWSVPYTARNDTLFNNRVHNLAFDSQNNMWVGHISSGVSQYDPTSGQWIYHTTTRSGLGGDEIRDILVVPAAEDRPEAVWFATRDGGLSRYQAGEWTTFRKEDGLPASNIRALALDRYERVWVATRGGVVFQTEDGWQRYNTLDTYAIAIGPACPDKSCPFDDDVVWTGTSENGLTHSRLPLPEPVLDIKSVCLVDLERERVCLDLSPLNFTHSPVITATLPGPLPAGAELRLEVTAVTRPPYQLRENRGDFLSNADASDASLFGAWPIIPVIDTIEPGQPYTFTDFDNPLQIPQLAPGQGPQEYVTTWRVWMHTRYAGPYIRILFTVE
jgi:hypothetical protein